MSGTHIGHLFVPARFIFLTLHLFGLFTLITPNGKQNSIDVTIYPYEYDVNNELYNAQYVAASTTFYTVLVWAILMCLFELLSMTLGFVSISSPLLSSLSVVIHSLATVLLFFTVFDGWAYTTFTDYIFWYTSFLPFILEVLLDIIIFRDNVRHACRRCYGFAAPLLNKLVTKND